jgi:hypothetical protein
MVEPFDPSLLVARIQPAEYGSSVIDSLLLELVALSS